MDHKIEDWKKIKAYHEAGHAAISYYCNFRITGVEIYPTKQLITNFEENKNGCMTKKIEEEIRIEEKEIKEINNQKYVIKYRGFTLSLGQEPISLRKISLVAGFVGEYLICKSEFPDLITKIEFGNDRRDKEEFNGICQNEGIHINDLKEELDNAISNVLHIITKNKNIENFFHLVAENLFNKNRLDENDIILLQNDAEKDMN